MDTLFASLRRQAYSADPDDALLARFLTAGDEGAFAEVVSRHGPLVYSAARRRLPDPADAADVFQATFLLLVRKAGRLSGRPTLGPWLYRVAALTARNLRRANARRPGRLGVWADPLGETDPTLRWDLDDALLALPERDRAAVVLCHLLGHSRREAADRLGLPEGTLSTVLHRALRKLRVRLDRDPRPVLAAGGVAVPVGLASAAGRAATAGWAAGRSLAGPGVTAVAGGTFQSLAWKSALVGGLVAVGLGTGLRLQPAADGPAVVAGRAAPAAEPRVGIRLTDRPQTGGIIWTESAVGRRPGLQLPVRTPDDLRPLLDRLRREHDLPPRLDLAADPGTPSETLLAVARVCVAAGFPAVHYTGPTPGFSVSFGTETHDWGRGSVVAEPTAVDLPTTFGLHVSADTAETRVLALVGRLKGTATRDDTLPGRPVVGVSLAFPLTDAQVEALAALPTLARLDLRGTGLTDAGLRGLAPLAGLTALDLTDTGVTDAALPTLARLPRLAVLDLTRTGVTDAGVDLFRRAVPGCQVRR